MRKFCCKILLVLGLFFAINNVVLSQDTTNSSDSKDKLLEINRKLETSRKEQIELEEQKLKLLQEEAEKTKKNLEVLKKGESVSTPQNTSPIETSKPATPTNPNESSNPPVPSNITNNLQSLIPQANGKCLLILSDPDSSKFSKYEVARCGIIRAVKNGSRLTFTDDASRSLLPVLIGSKLVKDKALVDFVLGLERKRTDKQVGADSKSSGTTSLAVKGGMPSVIGWAVENGGATTSTNGTSVTVRVNPYGLGKAVFLREGFISNFQENRTDSFERFLKKVYFGFTFDTTRGTDPPVFIGSKQQLSAVSFRYEFINDRNPNLKKNQQKFDKFFDANGTKLIENISDATIKIEAYVEKGGSLEGWFKRFSDEVNNLTPTQKQDEAVVGKIIDKYLEELPNVDKQVTESFAEYLKSQQTFIIAKEKVLEEINKGTVTTFEYTNYREPIAPDTSNFRFIWEKGVFKNTDFTFNASLTMYNKKPNIAGVKKIRDFQFALQMDTPLENTFGLGDSVLSFAGRYERLNGDTVDALGVVTPNSKGDVAVGQLKLTIPIANWGIKLPLSVTFANRTDLIKESTVRANFGFTFDLDPLFARFKPF